MKSSSFKLLSPLAFLLALLFAPGIAYAQQTGEITGVVIDSLEGEPLPGVNVAVEGTQQGGATDAQGNYTISDIAPGTYDVRATFVGYADKVKSVAVEAGDTAVLDFALRESRAELEEVVVVGYGSAQREDLTGSISSVQSEELTEIPAATLDAQLQGQVPGLDIVQSSAAPGGQSRIRIRGSNSIQGDNTPLIVIDGYPLPPAGEAGGVFGGAREGQTNALASLNPNEVESVQVLKDASATAIYGSRGANGVIIIETKGGQAQSRVSVTSEVAATRVPDDFPDLLTGQQYAELRNERALRRGQPLPYDGLNNATPEEIGQGTRWLPLLLRTGTTQRYGLSASGGSDGTTYRLSGNFMSELGAVITSAFQRGTVNLNVNSNLSDRFSVDSRFHYARVMNDRITQGSGLPNVAGPIFLAYKANPTISRRTLPGTTVNPQAQFLGNPINRITDKTDETENTTYRLHAKAEYDLLDALSLVARGGTESTNSQRSLFFPTTTARGALTGGTGTRTSFNRDNYVFESYLDYNSRFFDALGFKATAGGSFEQNHVDVTAASVTDFPIERLGVNSLQSGLNRQAVSTGVTESTLLSFYLRTNFNLNERYLLTFTGRADGSSNFAENNKWAVFPSAALAWRVSEEPFMQGLDFLSNLKLRASYGFTGSQAIPAYRSLARLSFVEYLAGDQAISGIVPSSIANPDLSWEETRQLNVGADIGLFDDRLNMTIDYYDKKTTDLLQNVPIPTASGFGSSIQNVGSIGNRGVELQLEGDILRGDFNWTSTLNVTHNESEILDLGGEEEIFPFVPVRPQFRSAANIIREGEDYGVFYGYVIEGLLQPEDFNEQGQPTVPVASNLARPGHWKYEDRNGDGQIGPADRKVIGNPNPDFTFGWSHDFSYKRLALSVLFQGSVGNDIMNLNRGFFASGWQQGNQFQSWYENRWTENNQHNNPRYPAFGQNNIQIKPSTILVEDGSYVRLKNLSLSYSLPENLLPLTRSARIYLTGTNLLTFTGYSGFDPEVGSFDQNNLVPGLDFGSYPRARTYTVGVNLGF